MPDLTEAITEAYAACPTDVVIFDTLEFRHPSFQDEENNPIGVRVVNDNQDLQATLEAAAPLNAGEEVTFYKGAFRVVLPAVREGEPAELRIEVSNVTRELEGYLELAVASTDPIEATYRPFLSTDTSQPHWTKPAHMQIVKVSSDVFRVTAVAGHAAFWNKPVPSELYTRSRFPQLVR